jgi:hypothetical protein
MRLVAAWIVCQKYTLSGYHDQPLRPHADDPSRTEPFPIYR